MAVAVFGDAAKGAAPGCDAAAAVLGASVAAGCTAVLSAAPALAPVDVGDAEGAGVDVVVAATAAGCDVLVTGLAPAGLAAGCTLVVSAAPALAPGDVGDAAAAGVEAVGAAAACFDGVVAGADAAVFAVLALFAAVAAWAESDCALPPSSASGLVWATDWESAMALAWA